MPILVLLPILFSLWKTISQSLWFRGPLCPFCCNRSLWFCVHIYRMQHRSLFILIWNFFNLLLLWLVNGHILYNAWLQYKSISFWNCNILLLCIACFIIFSNMAGDITYRFTGNHHSFYSDYVLERQCLRKRSIRFLIDKQERTFNMISE